MGYNILADPDEVATNAVLSFETALWFWTTPASPHFSIGFDHVAKNLCEGFLKVFTSWVVYSQVWLNLLSCG